MSRAFSLKFNYKCSPVCKWVYFFSLCLFLQFAPFHFVCPLQPIMWLRVMNSKSLAWQLEKKNKKNPAIPNTHLIFYTTKTLLFAEIKREAETRVSAHFSSHCPAFAPNILKKFKWSLFFLCCLTHLDPETRRKVCQLPRTHLHWYFFLEMPDMSHGLDFQQPLYHVAAHYHVLARTNVGNLTPEVRSRML